MLTALSVRIPEKSEGLKKWVDKLRRDKVEIQINRARGVSLRHITYTSYSGEVRLDRADRLIGAQRTQLLCSEKLVFPHKSGYHRFSSRSFSARLCTNMALEVLRECQCAAQLRLCVYDPHAVAADFVLHALQYCVNPVVVTDKTDIYTLTRNRALEELGAGLTLTESRAKIGKYDLIVAPSGVEDTIHFAPDAVVLTTGNPDGAAGGNIYHGYRFRMPNGFDSIKPKELSEEYFCSALYTLGSQFELGSIVPLSCVGGASSQTVKSLANLLDIHCKKEYNN
ncbi:MAG: hypothetical protein IJ598_11100 [Ruminococcus sp.]|nr:hypothetical protein [Ruminococcus sp.]